MRDAGTVLKVLDKLADTPGGGSNTKIRPARNRLEGSYNHIFKSTHKLLYILLSKRQRKIETYKTFLLTKNIYLLHYVNRISLNLDLQVLFTLGLISMVRNSLKLGWGVRLWSFFSRDTSQLGARWTFFSMTQRPDLLEALMALSAWVNPSAEPNNGSNMNSHQQ